MASIQQVSEQVSEQASEQVSEQVSKRAIQRANDDITDYIHTALEAFKLRYAKTIVNKYDGLKLSDIAILSSDNYDIRIFFAPDASAPGIETPDINIYAVKLCEMYHTHSFKLNDTYAFTPELIRSYLLAVSYAFSNTNDLVENVRIPNNLKLLVEIVNEYVRIDGEFISLYSIAQYAIDRHNM